MRKGLITELLHPIDDNRIDPQSAPFTQYVTQDNGNPNMKVTGSLATPVEFKLRPIDNQIIQIEYGLFILEANSINPNTFLEGRRWTPTYPSPGLTNGISTSFIKHNGIARPWTPQPIVNISQLSAAGIFMNFEWFDGGANHDLLEAAFPLRFSLNGKLNDSISIFIRDDLNIADITLFLLLFVGEIKPLSL